MVSKRIQVVKCSELDEKKREKIASLVEKLEEINNEDKMREVDEKIMRLLGVEPSGDYYVIVGYVDEKMNEDMASDDFPFLTWSRRCISDPDIAVIEIRQEL